MSYEYFNLDKNSQDTLYQQLYDQLHIAMAQGNLKKGQKLPSIRKMSTDTRLSRTTVETAYQQLCIEGCIESRPKRGYFVIAAEKKRIKPNTESAKIMTRHIIYQFDTQSVDEKNADIKTWKKYIRDVLNRQYEIVRYGDPQGESELRNTLSEYAYSARGVICHPDGIIIGAGTQPLLSILCASLRTKIGSVAMEQAGFPQAEQIFSDYGIEILKLPCDNYGIDMNALESSGSKAVYVTPSGRSPSGAPIPLSRRQELLVWAKKNNAIIIEDDYNGELRYKTKPVPAMQGMNDNNNVIYLGSFSKLLLPSVRIGYMVPTQNILDLYLQKKKRYNQTASRIEQLALAQYINNGCLEKQLRKLRNIYKQKSSVLIEELKKSFGDNISFSLWETRLCLIAKLKSKYSSLRLSELALLNGVSVISNEDNTITLSFAGIPQDDIKPSVELLRKSWM